MKKRVLSVVLVSFLMVVSGCGYTRHAQLPQDIQTIHVNTVINTVPLTEVYAYQPGLEIDITNAVINRFQTDGNLKIVKSEDADAILEMELLRYEQEGVRFSSLERIEEYRLFVVISMKLIDAKTNEVILEEPNFSGDAEYFVGTVSSIAREEATVRAIARLARNVVDRIVEDW